jgi:hypothetical protein
MKRNNLLLKLVAVTVLTSLIAIFGNPSESHAVTASANATADVVTPIAITKNADMAFGKFIAGTGGTVTMATTGTRTAGGAVTLFNQGSTSNAASFAVAGEGTYTYAITLPANSTVNVSDGASHTMAVNSFVSNPSGTGILTAGAQTLLVGATLTVASGQAPGNYTGTFNVNVDYN